jgi:hypothetical protein
LRAEDTLLLSANLAPVTDESEAAYRAAMEVVLPQYRNAETLDWVGRVLTDWGLETQVGEARVTVEKKSNLYRFLVSTSGKSWQLFFSYRHTPERLRMLLSEYSLELGPGLISAAKEEGVWRVNVKH